jgi:hypothetical protein
MILAKSLFPTHLIIAIEGKLLRQSYVIDYNRDLWFLGFAYGYVVSKNDIFHTYAGMLPCHGWVPSGTTDGAGFPWLRLFLSSQT